jgi:hypothetical protein
VRLQRFAETLHKRGIRQIVAVLLAAVLLVTVASTASHGHEDFGERPQTCAVCQAGYEPGELTITPEVHAPPPHVPAATNRETEDLPAVRSQPRFTFSRAPPA